MEQAFLSTHSDHLHVVEYPRNSAGECGGDNCFHLNNFVEEELRDNQNAGLKEVSAITMTTSTATYGDLSVGAKTCTGSTAVKIVDALIQASLSPFSPDSVVEFQCDSHIWKLGDCGSEHASICVDCANPCTDRGSADTLNCFTTDNMMKVLVVDLVPITECKQRQIIEQLFVATLSDAEHFTYYPEYSEGECARTNNCGELNRFFASKVRKQVKNLARNVTKVSLFSTRETTGGYSSGDMTKTCEGSPAMAMINKIIDSTTFNNEQYTAYDCGNGDTWKVGSCGDEYITFCVNCNDPCTDTASNFTMSCDATPNMRVLGVEFFNVTEGVAEGVSSHNKQTNVVTHLSFFEISGMAVACVAAIVVIAVYKWNKSNAAAAKKGGEAEREEAKAPVNAEEDRRPAGLEGRLPVSTNEVVLT